MPLDAEGWLPVDPLIANANAQGNDITLELLHEVVATCDKKRFALSDDGLKIRANQRHSLANVELNLRPTKPSELLYHGTVARFLQGSRQHGLQVR